MAYQAVVKRACALVLGFAFVFPASFASAEAPKSSIRPPVRTLSQSFEPSVQQSPKGRAAEGASLALSGLAPPQNTLRQVGEEVRHFATRPMPRPEEGARSSGRQIASASMIPSGLTERLGAAVIRPAQRPSGLERQPSAPTRRGVEQVQAASAIRPAPGGTPLASVRGSVCGVAGIQGQVLSPIGAKVNGCGIANPVRVTSVGGLKLSQALTVDCEAARALNTWVERGLKPAFGNTGGGVKGLEIAGSYVCRTRNHRKGAKISEHGRGKAVDISGIVLANGQKLTVLRDWRGRSGNLMRAAHRAACGPFGTTLGPGSDGMHEDHMHFDTARYSYGTYCR